MKQTFVAAAVAAVVAMLTVQFAPRVGGDIDGLAAQLASHDTLVAEFSPTVLSFPMENFEDSTVDGTRYTGVYSKLLTDAENSVCYLTKVHFRAMQGPNDSNMCSVELDEFTGHWQVSATVDEGSVSEARCNASCLVWE